MEMRDWIASRSCGSAAALQKNMTDPRLVPFTRCRIDSHDYDAVFTAGGCFVFALRLHERFGYKIRGLRKPSHVWAVKDTKGIDVRGFYPEVVLAALANGGDALTGEEFSIDEVQAEIAKKEYPPALLEELRSLADSVFDTHERFILARPPKAEVAALFSC